MESRRLDVEGQSELVEAVGRWAEVGVESRKLYVEGQSELVEAVGR